MGKKILVMSILNLHVPCTVHLDLQINPPARPPLVTHVKDTCTVQLYQAPLIGTTVVASLPNLAFIILIPSFLGEANKIK